MLLHQRMHKEDGTFLIDGIDTNKSERCLICAMLSQTNTGKTKGLRLSLFQSKLIKVHMCVSFAYLHLALNLIWYVVGAGDVTSLWRVMMNEMLEGVVRQVQVCAWLFLSGCICVDAYKSGIIVYVIDSLGCFSVIEPIFLFKKMMVAKNSCNTIVRTLKKLDDCFSLTLENVLKFVSELILFEKDWTKKKTKIFWTTITNERVIWLKYAENVSKDIKNF